MDTGPVYLQDGFDVRHPMRSAEAFKRQAALMASLASLILAADAAGAPLAPTPQPATGASYSIWRDAHDFDLDPGWDAGQIVRRVYALGHPYQGARIRMGDTVLTGLDTIELDDLDFAIHDAGKVWRMDPDGSVVICGRGMVKLTDLRTKDGTPWVPPRIRLRFERPSTGSMPD